ncbi:MAG TPA: hypothetical protein VNX25_10510 [Verrucomicrobiae bacterium]|nr:hypothetical protein [Verrucomicrobiae bacterium]
MNYRRDQPMYELYLRTLASLYGKLQAQETRKPEIRRIQRRIIHLTEELQSVTGDPYLCYHIGQLYIFAGDNRSAVQWFQKVLDHAPTDAFYRAPAKRLVERLGSDRAQ